VHPYRTRTMPSADAVGAVATWARTAGLAPDETGLSWLMDTDPQTETEASYLPADDHAFELVLALGIPSITPSRSPMLDPTEPPYSTITDRMGGLAAIARIELVHGSTTNSPDTWVLDAIDLDRRIWRAAFNEVDNIDIPELVGEIARLVVAHQDDRNKAGPPAATVTIGGRSVVTAQHLAETTRQMLSTQQVFRRPRHDRRPANHPVRRRHVTAMSRWHRPATTNGSTRSQWPPDKPQPIRGMCTEAPSRSASSPNAARDRARASYRMGGPALPALIPCRPIMFATQMSGCTWTRRVAPRAKSLSVPLAEIAFRLGPTPRDRQDEPLAQPPMSLQT